MSAMMSAVCVLIFADWTSILDAYAGLRSDLPDPNLNQNIDLIMGSSSTYKHVRLRSRVMGRSLFLSFLAQRSIERGEPAMLMTKMMMA